MKMILTDILLGDMVNYISNEPHNEVINKKSKGGYVNAGHIQSGKINLHPDCRND
jgi:hypothetical protein